MLCRYKGNKIFQFNDSFGCKKIEEAIKADNEMTEGKIEEKAKIIHEEDKIDYSLPLLDVEDDEFPIIDMIISGKLDLPIYEMHKEDHDIYELKLDKIFHVLDKLESNLLYDLYEYTLKLEMKIAYSEITGNNGSNHIDDKLLINCVLGRISSFGCQKIKYVYRSELKDHIYENYVKPYYSEFA